MDDFHDRLAPLYHLIFPDWDTGIEPQADHLAGVIRDRWGAGAVTVLGLSRGIGTQAIDLARRGFAVTASGLSAGAVERARDEAKWRGLEIDFSARDRRSAHDRDLFFVARLDGVLVGTVMGGYDGHREKLGYSVEERVSMGKV
jgi:hypothetical protein